MQREIRITDDLIDSRDIILLLEEQKWEIQDLEDQLEELDEDEAEREKINDKIEDIKDEYAVWFWFEDQLEDNPEWRHGLFLIAENYFVDYTQEYARDIGAINNDCEWPHMHIDWDGAAESLKVDFEEIDVPDGDTTHTFLFRSY